MKSNVTDILGENLEETQKHLINHIKLCNDYIERVVRQLEETNEKIEKMLIITQDNTKAIISLKAETRDIVDLYKDIQGATRLATNIQKFTTWVIKWPLIGSGIYFVYEKFIKPWVN